MLDPFGQRQRYYHFILNPVPNSTYDSRVGFITDPLHPLYGKADPSWNGDWRYATSIDKERNQWTAEVRIPYSTLGVPAPRPGARWTMNIGREEYPHGYSGGPPILSLWSSNLGTRSFHDPLTFGELLYQ